jgi:hypothetical protein
VTPKKGKPNQQDSTKKRVQTARVQFQMATESVQTARVQPQASFKTIKEFPISMTGIEFNCLAIIP